MLCPAPLSEQTHDPAECKHKQSLDPPEKDRRKSWISGPTNVSITSLLSRTSRPLHKITWIALWKNLMAISCSLCRLKQFPATHQAFRETERWAAARDSCSKKDCCTVSLLLQSCHSALKLQTIYLGTVLVHVSQVLRQSRQGNVLLQVPQSGRINLHSFNSVGLNPANLTKQTLCLHTKKTSHHVNRPKAEVWPQPSVVFYLCVFSQLKVSSANVCEHPASVVMLRRERAENADSFSAVVRAQREVATP